MISNLPARNPGFVGRDFLLEEARRLLGTHGRLVTQSRDRMGGVGKTQIAIEYAYRFAHDYDVTWLVPSEQHELIAGHLAQLAIRLGLVGADVSIPAAVAALHAAIQAEQRWLLIFDNAEDPRALGQWLPPRGGHIIITSRSSGWDEIAAILQVNLFSRDESVALLRKRMPQLSETDADRLAQELGDLPLAIAQAAAVMTENGISADEYLDLLAHHTAEILSEGTPTSYPISLAASVSLSADRLGKQHPAAAQLLNLCAMLAPEPIALEWFTKAADVLPQPLAATATNPYIFRTTVVKTIGAHGLIGAGPDGIQMHRLIGAIVRSRLSEEQRVEVRQQAEAVVVAAAPIDTDAPDTWPTWSKLAPHITGARPATTSDEKMRAVACRFVLYLLRRGESGPARRFVKDLYVQWRDQLGPDDPHTLKAATEYAHAEHVLGNIHEAHQIIADTLDRKRRTLGDDHPDTLRSAGDLSVSLHVLGEYGQARSMMEEVVARSRRVLGEDHPESLLAMHGLGHCLLSLKRTFEARRVVEDVLRRQQRSLGPNHPQTMQSRQLLDRILVAMGGMPSGLRARRRRRRGK